MRLLDSIRDDLDAQRWDDFVARKPDGHLLQTWAWGDLKGSFGWSPVRLAVERDGDIVAGAQVIYRHMGPLTLGYIPKGPIWCDEEPAAMSLLWDGIHRWSRRMRAVALKVEPEWRESRNPELSRLTDLGLCSSADAIQPRRTIIVDLTADEDAILARMKSKWRYNTRLSIRKGVIVREGGMDELAAFHQLMTVTGERDAFGVHSLSYYRKAMALFTPLDQVRLLLAYHDEELLAGLMVFAFNGQSWYMYGASSNAKRSLMPNHQLQFRAMQWAKSKGCTQYDLWGITDNGTAQEALSGVERFKAGFGGEIVRYVGAFEHVYKKLPYRAMNAFLAWRRGA